MEKLTDKEIENIGALLLSADSKNVELALVLLEQNQYAIPKIIDEISVFIFFNPGITKLPEWIQNELPNYALKDNPAFIFTLDPFNELEHLLKLQTENKIKINWQKLLHLARQVWFMQENHLFYHRKTELRYSLACIEWKGFQNYKLAEEIFKEALEDYDGDTKAVELAIEMFLEANHLKKAIEWSELLLQKKPFDIFVLMSLADLYFQNKDYTKAKKIYKNVVDMADYGPAKEGLERILKIEKEI